jgi:glycosyltransferase involved in cell wall biosynthesis/peptidoglycan/xylan/chitin deacetylase (PgdA/CDA1 family)
LTPSPSLSVLIATHNRREMLARCLAALAAQTQDPAEFEVIVVDDGSTDGTPAALAQLSTPFELRTIEHAKAGKPVVLNAAIEAARGEVCLFIDDDVIASPQLVAEHLAAHRREPRTLGIGVLVQREPGSHDPYAETHARRWNERYEGLADRPLDWTDCYGANFSAPRAALQQIGGFAVDLPAVEDLEIAFRLCEEAGCIPSFLPAATALHDDDKPGARSLAHEERYGHFCAEFARRHPATRSRLLGWINEPTLREVALRRALIALGVPARWLLAAGRLLPPRHRDVWFGFVSRFAVWRGVRRGMDRAEWVTISRGVPVLMYHAFSADGDGERFVMPARVFSRQMRLLALLRYRVIPLAELATALREGRPLPRRAVVLTIDDGYRDNAEVALPILRRRGFAADVFLVSERLGAGNDWDEEGDVAGRPTLSAEQIEQMRAAGIRFGAHTRTHRALTEAGEAELAAELRGSRQDLEAKLGEGVETLTYPYGLHDERVVEATREAGFSAACTIEAVPARPGDDPLRIPRVEIAGTDAPLRFLRKLWLGGN